MKTFKKILIANRGEIAVRIIRSAKRSGIKTVAIFSTPDQNALHVRLANEAYHIGGQELKDSYLNIDKIISTAVKAGCDAIHPGYGFLSENADFVRACEAVGITFIGPHTEAMRIMGNKIEARNFVKALGIPMTEGITGSPETLLKNADKLKFPVLVKAAAGGGGKGMRIVYNQEELENVLETTAREALNYFGDSTIYIEKYIEEPRHIEFQILGDHYGNVIHVFERECSIQRRYQKIIEESPSPTLTPELRNKMGEAAVAIGKKIGYNSAGTVEFLVDKELNFYFLEMNTRIQVEHPVTEMVTGLDLVKEQISIAAGNKLSFQQKDVSQKGHAIECRIYAEDPSNNFLPSPGEIILYKEPEGDNIRIDSGIDGPTTIHSFFDPMISKLIVWEDDRQKAIDKTVDALKNFPIHGIKTNISYLLKLLQHPAFGQNKISTKFCDEHTEKIIQEIEKDKNSLDIKVPLFDYFLHHLNQNKLLKEKNIWQEIGYWRNIMRIPFSAEGNEYEIRIQNIKNNVYHIAFESNDYELQLIDIAPNKIKVLYNEKIYELYLSTDKEGQGYVSYEGFVFHVKRLDVLYERDDYSSGNSEDSDANLFAPMPGKVVKVNVKPGDKVKRGTILLVVEAMKMENNIIASGEAVVEKIAVKEGDMVDTNLQLIFLKEEENQ